VIFSWLSIPVQSIAWKVLSEVSRVLRPTRHMIGHFGDDACKDTSPIWLTDVWSGSTLNLYSVIRSFASRRVHGRSHCAVLLMLRLFRVRQNDVEQVRSAARIAARASLASIVGCSTPRDFRRRMRSLSFRCWGRTAGASRSIYLAEPFKLSLRYSFCYRMKVKGLCMLNRVFLCCYHVGLSLRG